MKLIQCRFSSGRRVPLLVHAANPEPLPIRVLFIYVRLKLRHRAYYRRRHICLRSRLSIPMPKVETLIWMASSWSATSRRFWRYWTVKQFLF